jgi:hypothetical protein
MQSLLSELADVLGALSTSHETLLGRIRRIRLEGFAAVPSAAGFVPPGVQPTNPQLARHDVIEVAREGRSA